MKKMKILLLGVSLALCSVFASAVETKLAGCNVEVVKAEAFEINQANPNVFDLAVADDFIHVGYSLPKVDYGGELVQVKSGKINQVEPFSLVANIAVMQNQNFERMRLAA